MRVSYPFQNEKATKVFFLIANGKKNPAEIARILEVGKSTVYDNAEPLFNIGILKLNRREGVAIDWQAFAEFFLNQFILFWFEELIEDDEKKNNSQLMRAYDYVMNFKENEKELFFEIVIGYTKNIANIIKGNEKEIEFVLKDSVRDFGISINVLIDRHKADKNLNKRQKRVFSKIKNLNKIFSRMRAAPPDALDKAFMNLR